MYWAEAARVQVRRAARRIIFFIGKARYATEIKISDSQR
jgi:hypothetical protein